MKPDHTTCDCCQGVAVRTPQTISNRPGLSSVAYRTGIHSQFKASMIARLARELPGLKTRDDDDFTIALLDGWATVADVLTFYQERIANESYLRTATERRSLLELARLIGYELRPGVSASAYLAFILEEKSPEITIPKGTQVQSMPGENELPQKFETSIDILARPEWNELRARLTRRHPLLDGAGNVLDIYYLSGVGTAVDPGDFWLIEDGSGSTPVLQVVESVEPQAAQQRTRVTLQDPPKPVVFLVVFVYPLVALQTTPLIAPSSTTSALLGTTISAAQFKAQAITNQFKVINILKNLKASKPPPPQIMRFRVKASIFAHNAPKRSTLPANLREGEVVPTDNTNTKFVAGPFKDPANWVDAKTLASYPGYSAGPNRLYVYLDTTYDEIVAGSTLVLMDRGIWQHYEVLEVSEVSISEFTLSGKVTRVTVELPSGGTPASSFSVRTTTVYAQSELLELAPLPIESPLELDTIELNGWVDGLAAGQFLIVRGEDYDERGNEVREQVTIKEVEQIIELEGATRVILTTDLTHRYVRDTVVINANVASATHGETKSEVLGSGRGEDGFPRFRLRSAPLTYVSSADSATGAASTLEVRVDGIRWHEVADFRDSASTDRHYIIRRDDDGNTTIFMGDGRTGARVPTGIENVRATYRVGIGRPGNVAEDKISLLARRPLGVQRVSNPLPASGGADAEQLRDARRNAPLAVLTLERIVSLQDYEDFARAFAGIGKARATWSWVGEERGVFLTVAGVDGHSITTADDVYSKLLRAMRAAGDPSVPLRVAADPSYRQAYFFVDGTLIIDPDFIAEDVLSEVEMVLRERFAFESREFGQDVTFSEVTAAIHSVSGIIAVDIDYLYRTDAGATPECRTRLVAELPKIGSRTAVQPAELLLLDPRPLSFGVQQDG